MTDLTPTDLLCPTCPAGVLAGAMRTASPDGEPDATGYQCAGVPDAAPCDWFVVWPAGNAPITQDLLAAGVRR